MIRLTTCLALGLLLAACTSEAPKPRTPIGQSPKKPHRALRELTPPGLDASELVTLDATDAPAAFAVGRSGAGIFLFAQGGKIHAKKFANGVASADAPELVAPLANLGVAFSIKARADGSFVAFWDERVDQNHIFKLQRLSADGKPNGAALSLPPVADAGVSYADVALLGERALVVHEVTKAERLSIHVTAVAQSFEKTEGPPRVVVDGALAWYPAESDKGLALLVVKNPAPTPDGSPVRGTLDFLLVDPAGKAGPPRTLLASATAQIDAEILAVKGGYVVGWTDDGLEDGAVRVATVDAGGTPLSAPQWVAPPIGKQAFVGLAGQAYGAGERALIAWENVGQTAGSSRIVHLASTGADGKVPPERGRLMFDDTERPLLVGDGDGFAALTLSPARTRDADESGEYPSWPTLVRLGPDLSVRWSEPVRFAGAQSDDGVPEFVWNLSCNGACFALAADGSSPSPFFVVKSADRESTWRAPAWLADEERPPKVTSLRSVTEGPRLAGAQATRLEGDGAGQAIAWVTYFLDGSTEVEAAPKGESPYSATLGVRFTSPTGALGEPVIVSRRAVSLGGVAIAAAPSGKTAEAVVAWIANDKTGPQVYATRVASDGKKVAQKKVTAVSRDGAIKAAKSAAADGALYASSVAIARSAPADGGKGGEKSNEGFVVGWVDTRDKNGEVYVARLNKELEKVVPDKRVTTSKGNAADVSLIVRGSDAFVAFAEARDDKPSDIYFGHFDAFSLKKIDDDGRVYASAGTSRSPRLALAGSKLMLAWIEEDPAGDPRPATLRLAEVDATGRLGQAPRSLAAPDNGSITGFALTCGADVASCKLALSWSTAAGRIELGAASLDASGAPSAVVKLGTLASGPFAEPSFSFADPSGSSLYYAEDLGATGRLRQVLLGW